MAKKADKRDEPPGAGNTATALDIDADVGGRAMPVEAVISPQGDSANTFRETPGSTPWKAAVIVQLREGLGVEDIALRMSCDVKHVRDLVSQLRRHGLLPHLYEQARREWRASA